MNRFAHFALTALPFFFFTYITQPGHVTRLHFSAAYPSFDTCQLAAADKEAALSQNPTDPPNSFVGACKNSDSLDPEPTPTPISPY